MSWAVPSRHVKRCAGGAERQSSKKLPILDSQNAQNGKSGLTAEPEAFTLQSPSKL
jgi:hypothetical protein